MGSQKANMTAAKQLNQKLDMSREREHGPDGRKLCIYYKGGSWEPPYWKPYIWR